MTGSEVRTFWCEPVELYTHELIALARHACGAPGGGSCSARVTIVDRTPDPEVCRELPPPSDPGWPTECARCGRAFGNDWSRASGRDQFYRGTPDGELHPIRELPAGATWDAQWTDRTGPDGVSLCVKLPNGLDWLVDGPASNDPTGRPWDRTGDPREGNVTARPSIASGGRDSELFYHGFLTDGVLRACGDSKV